ncbi:MAG: diguanylate phosphodiesterase [Phenylobacterium sp. RIFCSPHIGHO2_01_FULL_69_31]|jgi:cyclic-di-GMP phosphodiesterase TipF (flagellum assembly factor)|uniref:flagella assembly cyclic-di-GMP phosphodiesterase TipF n=1 Tax=Phenylobacterium sp. RIFCSPHIGHO2_01_FULL_69_31 TaxID=1801944 RepID=UPI0008CB652F|nr:EAL domain-containing protein [Phenylobacterium sp. RIFCSPHIGHO2_01_FULL_69_31]OHB27470.1 MAG: diguanylate phosphodiesterase [Phenylobacterium sp. RIFCSPHIGHO2_01_FULL_69_31]
MRRLTLALLCATYLCLSLIVALSLWRNGMGWGVALSSMMGCFGLCLASHGMIMRFLEMREIRGEVEAVRDAHRILLDQVVRIDGRLTEVASVVEADKSRSTELSGEVHLLEKLVQKMSRRFDEPQAPYLAARGGQDLRPPRGMMEIVREALSENRVDLYLQPVVGLPQRKTVFYESFSRLRDASGQVIMPGEYLAVAEPAGLVTAIDNLLLFRCVQIVRRLARQDRRVGIFCNISMSSLGDDDFFPQFLDLLRANRDLAPALVFEVGQAAFEGRNAVQARNMARLADLGFRFSIDKVTNLDLDLQDLTRSDVKFVKVAAQTLLDELTEVDDRLVLRSMPDLAAEDFALLLRRYGVDLVAEKVESERQVVDILDLDIQLGQGHLFGEPRAIKNDVLAEAGAPPPSNVERLRGRAAA